MLPWIKYIGDIYAKAIYPGSQHPDFGFDHFF